MILIVVSTICGTLRLGAGQQSELTKTPIAIPVRDKRKER